MNKPRIHQPALARRWMAVMILFTLHSSLFISRAAAQNIEYWFDSDPGLGKALPALATPDADGHLEFQAPTSHLPEGHHLFGVRSCQTDANGIPHYGPTLMQTVVVRRPEHDGIFSYIEYFWDKDPGYGRGTPIPFTPSGEVEIHDLYVDTEQLSTGTHQLFVRAFGGNGWSPVLCQSVVVQHAADAGRILRMEYFWDNDPGNGHGIPIEITSASEVSLDNLQLSTEGLAPGTHLLGIRPYGGAGWGPTITQQVVVERGAVDVNLVEYFWDTDPGKGHATPLLVEAGKEVNLEDVEFSTADLSPGHHSLGIRARGGSNWGPTVFLETYVPLRAADAVINDGEYFFDDDPGFGLATPLNIMPGHEVSIEALGISTDGLSAGHHQLSVRYRGLMGWSPTVSSDIIVMPEAIIANAEYFWNNDPGYGHGSPLNITPGQEVTLDNLGIPTSEVHGDAVLFIRYRGPFGWSPTMAYPVMVDAEGNYTLNANAVTSMETRNYQSLSDAVDDFSDRGVGNNITLTLPTTNTDYQLDATTDGKLAQLAAISESMEQVSTTREGKSIGFKATENSGNTLTVTTTDEGLPTVLAFFAHTWLENVALTINGQTYDFSSWSTTPHSVEVCSGMETTSVSINAPMTGMTVSFTPLPYQGNALSGYATEASTTLPAMTIVNSSAKVDSVAYRVALSDGQGTEISSFTYYIYVRPRVGNLQFSGMLPVTGSSLDPGKTTLKWNAVPAAERYRLTVTDADDTIIEGFPVETDKTSYELTVVSGQHYKWQVVAIGPCDELTSPTMTFEGRLLPDLTVTSIVLPEAAEAGNTITVTATVTNQGEGATTENQWTDRLYYVVNSTDFQQAVQAAEVTHTGNLAVGAYYDVNFTMQAPYLEEGQLYVFVETDVTGKAMETNDDNNRLCSSSPAQLQPFYMNTTDLAALRQLYTDFGGDQWNGTKWNTASELITEGNWSGITFNSDGRVTAINLQGRGLKGTLNGETAPTLPLLSTLDLSHNALTGDVTPFVESLSLTSLNLSYNSISNISAALPTSISTLNVTNQTLPDTVDFDLTKMMDDDFLSQLPTIVRYNHKNRNYDSDVKLKCVSGSGNFNLIRSDGTTSITSASSVVYKGVSGATLSASLQSGLATGTTFQLTFSFPQGDATFNGETDILDLQATINFMFNRWNGKLYNYAAANLYPDAIINIQDAIRLVDVIINEPWDDGPDGPDIPIHFNVVSRRSASADAQARLYVDDNMLKLSTSFPIAAMDIVLSDCSDISDTGGMTTSGLSFNTKRTDSSLRLIAYSFNDGTLPVGETTLCHISSDNPRILCAKLSDAEANEVTVAISDISTGIGVSSQPVSFKLYSTSGLLVTSGEMSDKQTIFNQLPAGIYVLKLIYSDGRERKSKIRIESR